MPVATTSVYHFRPGGTSGGALASPAVLAVAVSQPAVSVATGIVLDASTPAASDMGATTATVSACPASGTLSPPAGSLAVIAVNLGYFTTPPGAPAVTVADSLANDYVTLASAWDTKYDASFLAVYPYASAKGAISVTAVREGDGAAEALFGVAAWVLTGCAGTPGAAGTGSSASHTSSFEATVAATVAGSWVLSGLLHRQCHACADACRRERHPGSQFLHVASGEAAYTDHAVAGAPGSLTVGWTTTGSYYFSLAALEILPAGTVLVTRGLGQVPHPRHPGPGDHYHGQHGHRPPRPRWRCARRFLLPRSAGPAAARRSSPRMAGTVDGEGGLPEFPRLPGQP